MQALDSWIYTQVTHLNNISCRPVNRTKSTRTRPIDTRTMNTKVLTLSANTPDPRTPSRSISTQWLCKTACQSSSKVSYSNLFWGIFFHAVNGHTKSIWLHRCSKKQLPKENLKRTNDMSWQCKKWCKMHPAAQVANGTRIARTAKEQSKNRVVVNT